MWSMGATILVLSGGLISLVAICSLIILVLRRNLQPLKFRSPWLILFSGLASWVLSSWMVLYLLSRDETFPIPSDIFCGNWQWVVWITYPMLIFPYVLRVYRILKIFSLDADGVIQARYWDSMIVREASLLKILFAALVLVMLGKLIPNLLDVSIDIPAYGCEGRYPAAWIGLNFAEILLCMLAIYKLRHIRDDYGISFELTLTCALWFTATLANFVALLLQQSGRFADGTYLALNAIIILIRGALMFIVSVLVPAYQTFTNTFVPLWSSCDALRSLETLLKDIVCIQYFRMFLTREANVEYILCWVEIELYRDLEDPAQLRAHALRIYEKYLQEDAELEIPMPRQYRAAVSAEIQGGRPGPTLFDDVQRELYKLMNNLFPRFLASDSCRQCLFELEREEHLKAILEKSEMI